MTEIILRWVMVALLLVSVASIYLMARLAFFTRPVMEWMLDHVSNVCHEIIEDPVQIHLYDNPVSACFDWTDMLKEQNRLTFGLSWNKSKAKHDYAKRLEAALLDARIKKLMGSR